MDMNTYGSHPDRYEPKYFDPPSQTLVERERIAAMKLESYQAMRAFLNEEVAQYITHEVPAQIERDFITIGMCIKAWGAKLGGLRSALKRQKV